LSDEDLEFDVMNSIKEVKLIIDGEDVIERYYVVTYGEHGMLTYEE